MPSRHHSRSFSQILFKWLLLLGEKRQTLSCTRTRAQPEGRVESTRAPISSSRNGTSTSQTPIQETPAAFPCTQSHLSPSNGAAHLLFSISLKHCPTLEGCTSVVDSLTAQSRGVLHRNFCSQATTAEGKGMPLGTPLGTCGSGGTNFVCFSFMQWKASNCTRLFL